MPNSEHVKLARQGADAWNRLVHSHGVKADFSNARLEGISFSGFNFLYGADFSNSAFVDPVKFDAAEFGNTASFEGAVFSGVADFRSTKWFGPSRFDQANFLQGAHFDGANFMREHSFTEVSFGQRGQTTDLRSGNFTIRLIATYISFKGAKFHKCDFSKSQFYIPAYFNEAVFGREIEFQAINFMSDALFTDATFGGPAIFSGTLWADTFDFSSTNKETERLPHQVHFVRCIFRGLTRFNNRSFKNTTDFTNSEFHTAPHFHGSELHQHTIFPSYSNFKDYSPTAEFSYRTLKLAMNRHQAHSEEMMFFGLEMRARRQNPNTTSKFLYYLYELTSNYGQSIVRPISGLAGLFTVSFVIYWLLYYGGAAFPNWNAASSLLGVTFGRTIPLIIPAMQKTIAGTLPMVDPFTEALLVGLHSILAGAFLFLLALGLRNKFRLKS